jgi:cation diffusion facilitator CzcD-associated flavoprotein CzcO
MASSDTVDVLIVGAGIAGINAAYHITHYAPKGTTYRILERRERIGGTWDLFRYPGIRCDSDMNSFSFSWRPWLGDQPIVGAATILEYMRSAATDAGVDRHILFNHGVQRACWSSEENLWTVHVVHAGDEKRTLQARWLILGTGYYNYDHPRAHGIPGLEAFQGPVVHPQFWPENLEYAGKNVAIIGSGATAVTLVPSLASAAAHVTMVQRSPTYIVSSPNTINRWLLYARAWLPRRVAGWIGRMVHILRGRWFVNIARNKPEEVRAYILRRTAKQLPADVPLDPHFTPRYNPWEQRLCLSPDGDFYAALRSGRASVATGQIETVSENTIRMRSGDEIRADIIVAATGLELLFGGGIELYVDDELVDAPQRFAWKGCMVQDVPNLAFFVGYVNASWTLATDASATLLMRLMRRMRAKAALSATPRLARPEDHTVERAFPLSSTYLSSTLSVFPKGGQGQWGYKKDYLGDIWDATWGDISTGLELR